MQIALLRPNTTWNKTIGQSRTTPILKKKKKEIRKYASRKRLNKENYQWIWYQRKRERDRESSKRKRKRREEGKVINFVMPILLCSTSVSTPPFTFVIARVHKIIRTAARGGGRGWKNRAVHRGATKLKVDP